MKKEHFYIQFVLFLGNKEQMKDQFLQKFCPFRRTRERKEHFLRTVSLNIENNNLQ